MSIHTAAAAVLRDPSRLKLCTAAVCCCIIPIRTRNTVCTDTTYTGRLCAWQLGCRQSPWFFFCVRNTNGTSVTLSLQPIYVLTSYNAIRLADHAVFTNQVMERLRRLRASISHADSAHRFTKLGVDVYIGHGKFTSPSTVEVRTAVSVYNRR